MIGSEVALRKVLINEGSHAGNHRHHLGERDLTELTVIRFIPRIAPNRQVTCLFSEALMTSICFEG